MRAGIEHRPTSRGTRRWIFILALASIGATCFGCVATYKVTPSGTAHGIAGLPQSSRILIGLAEDGAFGSKQYPGSGASTTREVMRAFSRCSLNVEALQKPMSLDDGIREAKERGFTHYVQPTILHWEDRNTEWSGKRDKMSIRVQIVESESGNAVDAVTIDGKSKWATFGGDHPEELLRDPLTAYAGRICR